MSQLPLHNSKESINLPPPKSTLPIIQKLISAYKLWHEFMLHIPKTSRYTLGNKIDDLFLKTIEYALLASYLHKTEKLPLLKQAIVKLDLLKFFLQVAWEIKAFDTKKYIRLSEKLDEVGRMLGGWFKGIQSKTPAK